MKKNDAIEYSSVWFHNNYLNEIITKLSEIVQKCRVVGKTLKYLAIFSTTLRPSQLLVLVELVSEWSCRTVFCSMFYSRFCKNISKSRKSFAHWENLATVKSSEFIFE